MDDIICISNDKNYLYECKDIIEKKLESDYNLKANKKKTRIYNAKYGFIFLGRRYRVIDNKIIINLRNESYYKIKKNIKKNAWLYCNNEKLLGCLFSSDSNYRHSYKDVNSYKVVQQLDRNLYDIRCFHNKK